VGQAASGGYYEEDREGQIGRPVGVGPGLCELPRIELPGNRVNNPLETA
jgi:hypothetical protein